MGTGLADSVPAADWIEGCDQGHLTTARARLLSFQTHRQPGLALCLEGGGGYSRPKRHDCFSSGVRTRCRDSSGTEGSLASLLKALLGEDHKENKQLLRDPRPEAEEWQDCS